MTKNPRRTSHDRAVFLMMGLFWFTVGMFILVVFGWPLAYAIVYPQYWLWPVIVFGGALVLAVVFLVARAWVRRGEP